MLKVCCFKWESPIGYRSQFTAEHVNVLRSMVARNYQRPHEFVCITDDATGIDPGVRIVELWRDHADVPNPSGPAAPSCYRRLKLFSAEARNIIGPRFVVLDLDTVVVGDLSPLWDRDDEFVIWRDPHPRTWYNGSMWLLTAGARQEVWDKFDPAASPQRSRESGFAGSDQAWISTVLGPGQKTWDKQDGVHSFRAHCLPNGGKLPQGARIVFFHGNVDPWGPEAQELEWVRENWR